MLTPVGPVAGDGYLLQWADPPVQTSGGVLLFKDQDSPAEFGATIGAGCYPDCDGNNSLNIDDFLCFQLKFALADPYADCDGNSQFNIDDFLCFQLAFALGC